MAEESGWDGGVGGVGGLEAEERPEADGGDDTGSECERGLMSVSGSKQYVRGHFEKEKKRGGNTHMSPIPKVPISTTFLYRAMDRPYR